MKLAGLAKVGLSAALVGSIGMFAVAFNPACDADEHRRSSPSEAGVGSCTAAPGEFPPPSCDPSDNSGCNGTGCTIDTSKCGAISCLPMATNTGSTLDFRFRRLNIIAPPSLTYAINPTLQTAIINSAVDLNANGKSGHPSCGETGKGTFTWLLRIDKTAGKITTGGAPPVDDPFTSGYCFYNHVVSAGDAGAPQNVQPVTIDLDKTKSTDTTFTTLPLPKLLVPIFLDAAGSGVIILPLTNPVLKDMTVTENGNCIGSLNPAALDDTCTDVFSTCSKWKTAGSLGGYITLEEADGVFIKELNQTLCVVLTQTAPANKCARDGGGKILAKGDYCAATQSPGGCQDSFWLAATFAASAIKINDGSTTPTCQGGAGPDAGGDSGGDAQVDSGGDAGSDAPADAPSDGG